MASTTSMVRASQVLTSTGTFGNTQVVIVGGRTYTFQTSLTDTDGNVLIGADAAASLQNLFDAINLSGTAGTQYAASQTVNAEVEATAVTATTLTVVCRSAGTAGNAIICTETQTNASWGAAVLAGGTGNLDAHMTDLFALNQINSELRAELAPLTIAAD